MVENATENRNEAMISVNASVKKQWTIVSAKKIMLES